MSFALGLSPQGHLIADEQVEENLAFGARDEEAVRKALNDGDATVLLWLAARSEIESLPITAQYWRRVVGNYLTIYCRQGGQSIAEHKPSTVEWEQMVQDAPPMKGGEYLTAQVLDSMWDRLHAEVQIRTSNSSQWMAMSLPHWRMVGRVTLHLAENRKSLDRPFAFLATYVHGLNADGAPRHLPLQQAIKEYAGTENRAALLKLLEPLSLAAEKSEWMRDMVDGGHIYRAQGWTPGQALIFLHQIALFEASGLSVRIPDWWKAASPPRPKVEVELGGTVNTNAGFNIGSLMKFNIEISLEGEKLTPEEIEALKTAEGLVLVKGKWVEVDSEKLQAVLKHWQHARAMQFQGGMSFLQAMRLLSGMPEMGNDAAGSVPQHVVREWSSITPGPWLQDMLANMRDPAQLQELTTHPDLKAQLRPYQAVGVNWLRFMTRLGLGACLADDMGLGKTIQVLALLLAVKRMEPDGGPSLLVAPASLLQNWAAEVEKFAPSLRLFIAHNSGSEEDQDMLSKLSSGKLSCLDRVDLVVTSYAMLTRLKALGEFNWRLFIVDEAQYIKNADSVQSKTVRRMQATAKIALTGTPVENRLGDLWALFDLINPGLLGNATAFRRFIKSLTKGGEAHYTPLRRLVRPYILRRLKTDKSIIQDLPDKTELTTWCLLTKPQAILYQQAVQTLIKTLAEVDADARRGVVLSALLTFKQICNHPAQHSGDSHYEAQQSGKFLRLQELCSAMAERQEKVLIFTQFTQIIPALRSLLRGVFKREGLVLTGSTPVKERQELVKTFQSENAPPFFILSLKAGGTGLTLTAASHVIHFDRWWNPAVENQATDRAYRIGQKKNVLVHKFVCRGTLEEKIDKLIGEKNKLAGSILQAGEDELPLTEMSDAELIELVSMDINQTMEGAGE